MNEASYPFRLVRAPSVYEFESVSVNKKITKTVLIEQSRSGNDIYNLALMDAIGKGKFSDQVESRNGDLRAVLATVFLIVNHFLDRHPGTIVGFRGNDARRHRLYRIALTHELPYLAGKFEVFGGKNDNICLFEPNVQYEIYFIKKL
jgi:hypothetical protein